MNRLETGNNMCRSSTGAVQKKKNIILSQIASGPISRYVRAWLLLPFVQEQWKANEAAYGRVFCTA